MIVIDYNDSDMIIYEEEDISDANNNNDDIINNNNGEYHREIKPPDTWLNPASPTSLESQAKNCYLRARLGP